MKIPNLAYRASLAAGCRARRRFTSGLGRHAGTVAGAGPEIPLRVCYYAGEASLPEWAISARTLLRHLGTPREIRVVSDGTITPASATWIEALHPSVVVTSVEGCPRVGSPEYLHAYFDSDVMGKKLATILSLDCGAGPWLYTDTDVVFFPGAAEVARLAAKPHSGIPAYFMGDCHFSGDERLLHDPGEKDDPVNAGFLLLRGRLDWSDAFERLREVCDDPTFFTEQTATHLTVHASGGRPLDPDRFVLTLDDQFRYGDVTRGREAEVAARHYVSPVRHKMWNTVARWPWLWGAA